MEQWIRSKLLITAIITECGGSCVCRFWKKCNQSGFSWEVDGIFTQMYKQIDSLEPLGYGVLLIREVSQNAEGKKGGQKSYLFLLLHLQEGSLTLS